MLEEYTFEPLCLSCLLLATQDESHRALLHWETIDQVNQLYPHSGFRSQEFGTGYTPPFSRRDASLGSLFIIDYENVRMADGQIFRVGDALLEKNSYRHPNRQGFRPEEGYIMQHEIYSQGVSLMDIGLWELSVSYPESEAEPVPSNLFRTSVQNTGLKDSKLTKDILGRFQEEIYPHRS